MLSVPAGGRPARRPCLTPQSARRRSSGLGQRADHGHGPNAQAIVLGGDVNGLGVARSLGKAGVPLLLLDTDLTRPSMRTRYGRKMAVPALSGDALLDFLDGLSGIFATKPVLFATQEASVATLSAAYARVRAHYALALPDHALVGALLDKKGFQARAEALGFAVPKSRFLSRGGDEHVFDELRFPCVLKPTTKDEAYARQFAKAYRIERQEDAIALWRKMQSVIDHAIIQEWIEGADSDVYFCLQYRPPSGGPATSFCGRKTLQWPPQVGGTATCIPAPEEAAWLTDETNAFFGKVGFVGLCSMEYKRDRITGTFYMIEPTVGRTDYQEEIATLNGVNIPLAAYCDLSATPRRTLTSSAPASGRAAGAIRSAIIMRWPPARPIPPSICCPARPSWTSIFAWAIPCLFWKPSWRACAAAFPPSNGNDIVIASKLEFQIRLRDFVGLRFPDAGPKQMIAQGLGWLGTAQDHSASQDGVWRGISP